MGREVRMVPENWEHPKQENGNYHAMYEMNYEKEFNKWLELKKNFDNGYEEDWETKKLKSIDTKYKNMHFEDYYDTAPDSRDYMPTWKEEEKTHFMMYETTSEGTPISPAFRTPKELATWLFDNDASSFGQTKATYEQWLNMIEGSGFAVSMVAHNGKLESGVAGLS